MKSSKEKAGKKSLCVLHVRNSPLYGGVETTMLGWLDHIDSQKFFCPVALFNNRNSTENSFRSALYKNSHTIFDLPWGPGRNFVGALKHLLHFIREYDVRLIHTHDWRSDVIGYVAARIAGIPVMTTIYVWFDKPLKIKISEVIDSFFIRRFDLVTAVCEATRCQTVSRGINSDKTAVLVSGISTSRDPGKVDRKKIREKYGFRDNDICFVFVARFFPEKAHDVLVDAFKKALAFNSNIRLLLLGIGPLEDCTRIKCLDLGIDDKVVMPGFAENVPDILKSMDVMVHASLAEGISLAIYEGMLMGLPVIGSNVDGTPEVVIPGKTGWLVPPGDSEALGKAILDAAEKESSRKTFGLNARHRILTRYSMKKAAHEIESRYSQLLSCKKTANIRNMAGLF